MATTERSTTQIINTKIARQVRRRVRQFTTDTTSPIEESSYTVFRGYLHGVVDLLVAVRVADARIWASAEFAVKSPNNSSYISEMIGTALEADWMLANGEVDAVDAFDGWMAGLAEAHRRLNESLFPEVCALAIPIVDEIIPPVDE